MVTTTGCLPASATAITGIQPITTTGIRGTTTTTNITTTHTINTIIHTVITANTTGTGNYCCRTKLLEGVILYRFPSILSFRCLTSAWHIDVSNIASFWLIAAFIRNHPAAESYHWFEAFPPIWHRCFRLHGTHISHTGLYRQLFM